MPRRPDVPCSSCGKLIWRGTGSLPAGQARCRDCRREAARKCPGCGVQLPADTTRCWSCHLEHLAQSRNPAAQYRETHSRAWRRLREQVLAEEPECALQFPDLCTGKSDTAGHIELMSERPDLILVRSNVRGVCRRCNHARRLLPNSVLVLPARPVP